MVKDLAREKRKRKGVLGDAAILEPAFLNKHVILKEGTRTCSLRKKKTTDCLLKDLKVIEKQSGKKGKRRTKHVKAEITGYPRIISVCVYLGLP